MNSLQHNSPTFPWAESLFPERLKSPWWIGHIPFAFELIGRMRPRTTVELGTYSGSSFAAFCQAVEASGGSGQVYGVDLWEGDVHMGSFDEALYQEMAAFCANRYPTLATLIRKDFNEAAHTFADGSIDLLHIDGTHTFEAVSNDVETWLPKMSSHGVILFHDINVTETNAGPAAAKFGVRKVFDGIKGRYKHCEFDHCFGLGVIAVGDDVAGQALELIAMSSNHEVKAYFAEKGEAVSQHFTSLGVELPQHGSYGNVETTPVAAAVPESAPAPNQLVTRPPLWKRALNRLRAFAA